MASNKTTPVKGRSKRLSHIIGSAVKFPRSALKKRVLKEPTDCEVSTSSSSSSSSNITRTSQKSKKPEEIISPMKLKRRTSPRLAQKKTTDVKDRNRRKSFLATPKTFRKNFQQKASTIQKSIRKRPSTVKQLTLKRKLATPGRLASPNRDDMPHLNNEKKVLFSSDVDFENSPKRAETKPSPVIDDCTLSCSNSTPSNQNVMVVARLRPLSTKEINENSTESIKALTKNSLLILSNDVKDKGDERRRLEYDCVFGPKTTQREVYENAAGELVRSNIFKGFNVTILAYGQTGSGKTFTMGTEGSPLVTSMEDSALDSSLACLQPPSESDGVIPRAVFDVFNLATKIPDGRDRVSVQMSYLEIYNEEIRDLLSDSTPELNIRDTRDGVVVPGLSLCSVSTPQDVSDLMKSAAAKRATASTAMNAVSSRSHAICTLHVVIKAAQNDAEEDEVSAKLTLVDLAGSERIKRTGAEGARMKEGININKGLFVLGQVVSALSEMGQNGKDKNAAHSHIPYRDSKLTRLLQDSLGGNSRTVMIACVSPANSNIDESTNTLRYATRTRNIKNTAVRNVVATTLSAVEAAALRKENQMLKLQLFQARSKLESLGTSQTISNISQQNVISDESEDSQFFSIKDLNVEKLEIVTKSKATVISLRTKIDYLEEKLDASNENLLKASIRGDKWQSQYEALVLVAKQNNLNLPDEENKENESVILQLRSEIQQLNLQLQESREDAAVARATAAVIISNNGDLRASEDANIVSVVSQDDVEDDESERRKLNEKLTSDLVAVNNEIEQKEAMALQSNKEREAMNALRSHFEEALKSLEEEVDVLTSERQDLKLKMEMIENTEGGTEHNDSLKVKRMKEKISDLEARMKILKKKSTEHAKSLRMRDMAEKKCEQLANEIIDNKKRRAALQKKLKEESVERRAEKKAAQLQATKIMRDKQKLVIELNKVKQAAAKQAAVLRRKAVQAINRQKTSSNNEKRRNIAAAMRNASSSALSSPKKNDIMKWLEHEMQTSSIYQETRDQIEEQNIKLEDVLSKKDDLISKIEAGDKDPSIPAAVRILENEISSRTNILKQLENIIGDVYNADRTSIFVDHSTWNSFARNDLKYLQTITFERMMDMKHECDSFKSNHTKLTTQAVNDALGKEKRRSEDVIMKLKMQHSEDMMSLLESTQGAVQSNVMLKVLENSEGSGVEPSIQSAVDDLLRSYMAGCDKIGSSIKRELEEVRETQDGMKKMVDQVAVNLVAQNEKAATKKKKRKKLSVGLNEEEEKFVFADDDVYHEDSDDSDWDPDELGPRVRKKQRKKDTKVDLQEDSNGQSSIETTDVTRKLNSLSLATEDQPAEPESLALENNGNDENDESRDKFYDTMKVSELKDLLRKKGLKVSGKKSDLLKRLRSPEDFDQRRQSEIFLKPKLIGKAEDSSSKENIQPEFTIYSENESSVGMKPKKKNKPNPLKLKDINELEPVKTQPGVVEKLHEPILRRTRTNAVGGVGAERRRNLANKLKASLRETELLL